MMTAIFGIDESNAQDFIEQRIVCYPQQPNGKPDLHGIVSTIKNQDIIFIKRCTPGASLHIKAVGIVQSDYVTESEHGVCLPVEWVWQGIKVLQEFGEVLSLCGNPLYEEHNVVVQREIINLLPEKYQIPVIKT
jgi:hypothetical protein